LRDVFADIGDEQSIAQSLSTFSGHLRRIITIVERAGPGTLVLLDELGAGTDPTEGAALAQAILDHLLGAGALIAATTHSAALKVYAHTTPGVRNAAVEFDLETLRPTYRLSIGLPGGSQAFAIAERLGLPAAIVAAARSRLTEDERAFEATLARIREAEREAAAALEAARRAEERATDALRLAEEERRRAKAEREAVVAAARAEAEALVEQLRAELAAARRALERETLTVPRIDERVARAEAILAALPTPAGAGPGEPGSGSWRVGDWARSRRGGWEGRIVAFDRSRRRARLEAGGKRISAAVADLVPADPPRHSDPAAAPRPAATPSHLGLERARRVASSLDLRGARVEEAVRLLERYLDDAALAGLREVTIVHGVGTGSLRDAVRSTAMAHPLVGRVRGGEPTEGGDGVTIVAL
jgi:DNA mismatch repair protein MutS2